jgi:hypothetical protein
MADVAGLGLLSKEELECDMFGMIVYMRRIHKRRGIDTWHEGRALYESAGDRVVVRDTGNVLFDGGRKLFVSEIGKGRIRLCIDEGCPHYGTEHSHA